MPHFSNPTGNLWSYHKGLCEVLLDNQRELKSDPLNDQIIWSEYCILKYVMVFVITHRHGPFPTHTFPALLHHPQLKFVCTTINVYLCCRRTRHIPAFIAQPMFANITQRRHLYPNIMLNIRRNRRPKTRNKLEKQKSVSKHRWATWNFIVTYKSY